MLKPYLSFFNGANTNNNSSANKENHRKTSARSLTPPSTKKTTTTGKKLTTDNKSYSSMSRSRSYSTRSRSRSRSQSRSTRSRSLSRSRSQSRSMTPENSKPVANNKKLIGNNGASNKTFGNGTKTMKINKTDQSYVITSTRGPNKIESSISKSSSQSYPG